MPRFGAVGDGLVPLFAFARVPVEDLAYQLTLDLLALLAPGMSALPRSPAIADNTLCGAT